MEFDVTQLDRVVLLQTLYLHADPVGMGIETYESMLKEGKVVEGLPKEECDKLLKKTGVIDYHNGKPLKLLFSHRKSGQIILSSHVYDYYHGQYRFLEALLAVFDLDEIIVHEIEESQFKEEDVDNASRKETIAEIQELLRHLIPFNNEFGVSYKIDTSKVSYKSGYLREIGLAIAILFSIASRLSKM